MSFRGVSSSSSFPFSLFSIGDPKISEEDLKTFHQIDREIYARLILSTAFDEGQAMQIMGLWIWLERKDYVNNLISQMLSFPDTLLISIANEAILCLNCTETDNFPFSLITNEIPITSRMTNPSITLKFFHDNRIMVLREITKIVNEVCTIAFNDLSREELVKRLLEDIAATNDSLIRDNYQNKKNQNQAVISPPLAPMFCYEPVPSFGLANESQLQLMGSTSSDIQIPVPGGLSSTSNYNELIDAAVNFQALSINEIMIGDSSSGGFHGHGHGHDQEKEVAADDRTIFLTFSKGYRISETEVRDFFTRKHGDCIGSIHMQEVQGNEQPLYARLVVKNGNIIEGMLENKSKAKFSINGKHVWARKYVPKNSKA